MKKDKRYIQARVRIGNGTITRFHQLFEITPKELVYKDMRYHRPYFVNKEFEMEKLILRDIFLLSDLFDIRVERMFTLLENQRIADKNHK